MGSFLELIQRTAGEVMENSDRVRIRTGVMMAGGSVRCGEGLLLEGAQYTQLARERKLKPGEGVLVLLDSGGATILDRLG